MRLTMLRLVEAGSAKCQEAPANRDESDTVCRTFEITLVKRR